MSNLDKIHYVTAHYPHFQGLRVVPLGVPFLASAAWRAGWLHGWAGSARLARFWFFGSLGLAVALSFVVRAHYRQRFGGVRSLPWRNGAVTLSTGLLWFLVVVYLQGVFNWAISLPAIFLALILTYLGMIHGGVRKHYVVMAAVFLVLAHLGLVGVPRHVRDVVFDLGVGVGLIIAGIGDHVVLQDALEPRAAEDYARSV